MISSLIKRIQKTVNGKPIDGDSLDELAAVNLSSVELPAEAEKPEPQKPDPPKSNPPKPAAPEPAPKPAEAAPKPETKPPAPPAPATPPAPKPVPKPAPVPKPTPKPEAVITVNKNDLLINSFIAESKKWLNVKEKGPNKGPEVERFQKAVDGKASGEPWCCSFVWFCILETEKAHKARFAEDIGSWLFKTEHCLTMWNLSPKESKLTAPVAGSIIVWQHLSPEGKQTAKGHVGIVSRVIDKTFIETIEGNTSNDSVVQDEGDGVYLLKRNYKQQSGSKRVVGFLKPWKEI